MDELSRAEVIKNRQFQLDVARKVSFGWKCIEVGAAAVAGFGLLVVKEHPIIGGAMAAGGVALVARVEQERDYFEFELSEAQRKLRET